MTAHTELNADPSPLALVDVDNDMLLASLPSILILVDEQLTIRTWNLAAEKMFARSAHDVLGCSLSECCLPWSETKIRAALADCRHRRLATRLEPMTVSTSTHGPRLIGVTVHPWGNDHLDGFLILAADITERAQAHAAASETEAHYKRILNSCPAIVYTNSIEDGGYPCTYVSDRLYEVMGYRAAEMIDDSDFWYDRVHEEDRPTIAAEFANHMELGGGELEYRFRHRDGHYLWIQDRHEVVRDEAGVAIEIIGSWTDITERKASEEHGRRMEVQLRQAQKLEAIGQLAAGVAHEINTPTQFVTDNVHFLQDSCADLKKLIEAQSELIDAMAGHDAMAQQLGKLRALSEEVDIAYLLEEIPAAIRQTLEGTDRIAQIVRAMKEFSHPGSDTKTPINLNDAIASTLTVARNEWKYVADVEQRFDPDLPLVPCLPGDFNQVVLNLVVNAAHAISEAAESPDHKGVITIRTRRSGDSAEISISDTGCGIPQDLREKIFDPFFTTKDIGKGTGQGLAIAHAVIVDKHAGTLQVDSELGQGTTFTITLPLDGGENGGAGS